MMLSGGNKLGKQTNKKKQGIRFIPTDVSYQRPIRLSFLAVCPIERGAAGNLKSYGYVSGSENRACGAVGTLLMG